MAARPDAPTDDQAVAVFLKCVGTGQIADVRAMLTVRPDLVNAVGSHPFWGGRPQALHVAIEGRRRDMFDLLLEHGADVSGANADYDLWSPLMISIDRNQPEMRDELIRRGTRVGLVEALMLGDDARVEERLEAGGLPDIAPNGGSILAFARTPLAIDRLIALGARTDVKDRWGSTPIDAMSRLGERGRALVERMVAHGVHAGPKEYARLDDRETLARLAEDDRGVTRLDAVMMAAVDFRHHALVEWLLERGGDANARADGQSRHTALHSAAWNGDLRMVELLVAAGADVTSRDEEHNATPLAWAETSIEVSNNPKCTEVVDYLERLMSGSG